MDLKSVIKAPVISETSLKAQEDNVYVFWVDRAATKGQIKEAVQMAFGVKVVRVNTAVKGPQSRRDWRRGKNYTRPARKKAYVKIAPDQKISLLKGK